MQGNRKFYRRPPNRLAMGYQEANLCVCAECCAAQPGRMALKSRVLGELRGEGERGSYVNSRLLDGV